MTDLTALAERLEQASLLDIAPLVREAASVLRSLAGQEEAKKNEEWRDVVGFEGRYQVSSFGGFRSSNGNSLSTESLAGDGYVKATLWKDGERTQTYLHRLVCEAVNCRADCCVPGEG